MDHDKILAKLAWDIVSGFFINYRCTKMEVRFDNNGRISVVTEKNYDFSPATDLKSFFEERIQDFINSGGGTMGHIIKDEGNALVFIKPEQNMREKMQTEPAADGAA